MRTWPVTPGNELAKMDGRMRVGCDPFVVTFLNVGVHVGEISDVSRSGGNGVENLTQLEIKDS